MSRGWLYRHFPDKVTLLGAAIVRLNNAYWTDAHAMLASIEGLDNQIVTGIQHGRTAYDDPGALLMKLRVEEPDEFAAVLEAISADFVVDGDTVTISGDDDEVWSGVNMAMANGYAAGLSRVEVLGKVWTPDKPGWRDAATDSAGAVLTLG